MFNITLVCLIFFLLFGIFGVNQFKGAYYYCDIYEVNDKLECFDKGGSWVNKNFNFDNVVNAIVTLFVISTTEGWIDLMSDGIDSRGIDLNPKVDNAQAWALYFVLFIIVGAFFIMNLFAGVIVDAFQNEKERLS
jgi:TRAP-type C4-dicarboxylate transport system permease small subunit